MTRLAPDLVWHRGRFRQGLDVVVDPETGRIESVVGRDPDGGSAVRLPDRALIPGFVNAHSHAFQRLIRGRTQTRPAGGEEADFWSWREAMYAAALTLTPDEVYRVSRFCFLEMMRTGITAVGEFHYLHHQTDGTPYPDPNELALRVIAAAEDVGMRIVLLDVCYATGGIGTPLEDRQRRFRAPSLDAFVDRVDRLRDRVREARGGGEPGEGLAAVGVAPHSIRAVPREWLRPLHEWASTHDTPLHMHVSERPAEVEACRRAYGLRPVELLAGEGLLDDRFTAVHATHLTDDEVRTLGASGATVCACPTTERGLGDGFLRGLELMDAGATIALGTDSHTNLDFLEEMRLVEYHERLRRLRRVVLAAGDDDGVHRVAPELIDMATRSGARSLRIDAGAIEPGRLADLVAVDLRHHSLAGWRDDTLAPMLALSATPDVVSDVWVAGRRRLEDRRHADGTEIGERFREVAARPR
jgi:formimidoylglutamate deiminase